MWSTGWCRWRAACSTMPRCSTSSGWPTNSASVRGRSPTSSSSSSLDEAAGSTTRASIGSSTRRARSPGAPASRCRRLASTARTSRRARAHRLTGWPARAAPGAASPPRRHRRVGRRARRGSRRGRSRARSSAARASARDVRVARTIRRHRLRHATPTGSNERSGRSSRLFSSISSRAAVLRPTPGTVHSVSRSSSSTAVDSAAGDSIAMMASASAGPTPCEPSSTSKQRRSSSCTKP